MFYKTFLICTPYIFFADRGSLHNNPRQRTKQIRLAQKARRVGVAFQKTAQKTGKFRALDSRKVGKKRKLEQPSVRETPNFEGSNSGHRIKQST